MKNPSRVLLPVDIPLGLSPSNDVVFVRLQTLDALDGFWQAHRNQFAFACEGKYCEEPTYLRQYDWVFGATKAAVIRTVLRWGRSGISCEFYNWAGLEPQDHEHWFADLERYRADAVARGAWSAEQESDFERRNRQSYRGWWRLRNLPHGQAPDDWFDISSDREELIDPSMPLTVAEHRLHEQTFDEWMGAVGGDVETHDRASLDETIRYWRTEQAAGEGYYGDEHEMPSSRTINSPD